MMAFSMIYNAVVEVNALLIKYYVVICGFAQCHVFAQVAAIIVIELAESLIHE